METPIIEDEFVLRKFPGKGGWTFAEIPGVKGDKSNPFGWLRVKGSIDSYLFSNYHMMPMGNGNLFLPVKAVIRKQINKQAGDTVHVILYPDNSVVETPPELEECLAMEPGALSFFRSLKQSEQKELIDWIYSSSKDETRAKRIVKTIDLLLKNKTRRSSDIA